jgi:hypothetical protein
VRVETSRPHALPDDVEEAVTAPQEPATGDTEPDHSRSGADIAEAIEVAERGSSVQEVHDRGTENTSGEAPVEQAAGDPEMTEGQVVLGEEGTGRHREPAQGPAEGSSGAAQSQTGPRVSDVVAGDDGDGSAAG